MYDVRGRLKIIGNLETMLRFTYIFDHLITDYLQTHRRWSWQLLAQVVVVGVVVLVVVCGITSAASAILAYCFQTSDSVRSSAATEQQRQAVS